MNQKTYVQIVDKLKAWRAQTKVLVDVMESTHQTELDDLKNKTLNRLTQVTDVLET